ncbi:maltose alpha-D-glucosyltransferase [Spirosoma utsteinense]|uniref:Maltokinase n=1 Tax=Spirosoma utsteinense TaxID=2585773 RepID=A0ABR6W9B2_9BACT|nr:maltose alpha-D-glucosyltransferase [Spirosoma utsteinense]MBC3787937.1 maltose alpha-D-glucosyltransferase/alpha-amylase [Spirosoma utsteinense]MBC3793158.1 maltose alpha-D-glucosyltransferase/alpha-amylase [Spirosoma utsteinense]
MTKSNAEIHENLLWYKDAIIYELHIKAFRDGNGDGIGDFQGLLEKLDYLQELGVTAIWLLPFYPSPLRDDGYDIADYYTINPSYGTIEQFKTLLEEAHQRNLKVITELVINHSSDQHPWFQRARRAPKGSPERDYYVWTDDPTQFKDVRIIFQDFETSNWTWDPEAQQYYWHRFFYHQPDLNYDSPLVQSEVFKMIDYWCELGVDGFRLDAVPYLFEREGTNGENLPETHAFLKKLRKHIDDHFPSVVFLAEANMWPEDSASYFGDGDECHMNYHFPVMPRMFMALQMEDRYPITDIFDQTPAIPDTCQWAIFLRNHDELTLEMVTDEERDYMYKTYAQDPKAKINLGIRHRLSPLMGNNRKKIELLNSLLFSLPGTPVIYYGDEIGMGDNVYLGDRDGVRTPMQWSPDRNAGFSSTNPQKLYLPTVLDPEYHYESVNVETQRRNTSSLFWFMKRMINLRKMHKAFGRGDLVFLNVENSKVLAFTRTYEDETLLIVINLSKYAQPAEVELKGFKGYVPVEVFSKNAFPAVSDTEAYFFTLAPHDYQWFVLEKTGAGAVNADTLPSVQIAGWDQLLSGRNRQTLETDVLPDYLPKTDWFNGKGQVLHGISIVNHATLPLAEGSAYVLLIEVSYERGLPELFQLVVAFAGESAATKLSENCPQSVLATLNVGAETGVLCDGLYMAVVQQAFLMNLTRKGAGRANNLTFQSVPALDTYVEEHPDIKSKLIPNGPGYASISYDYSFLLKLYRKVDRSINPDTEITRFLSETAHFKSIPAFAGALEMTTADKPVMLGTMQEMVDNHGDGKGYVLERINNYIERILARDKEQLALAIDTSPGTLVEPVAFADLPFETQELLGNRAADQARLLGIRIGQMHKALASSKSQKDFAPEDFSLHYQRSLFSGLQSLVRESHQIHKGALASLPPDVRQQVEQLMEQKERVLTTLRRIYSKKLDTTKIRIHGDLKLEKIMVTGRDIAIQDFGGDPARSYSERQLKRSPLRDVASMIHSFYYTTYEGFLYNNQVPQEETLRLLPFAEFWVNSMRGFFVKAYLETVRDSSFVPKEPEEQQMMLETYLLEKAVSSLTYELSHRPDWVRVPLQIIKSVMDK